MSKNPYIDEIMAQRGCSRTLAYYYAKKGNKGRDFSYRAWANQHGIPIDKVYRAKAEAAQRGIDFVDVLDEWETARLVREEAALVQSTEPRRKIDPLVKARREVHELFARKHIERYEKTDAGWVKRT